LFLRNPFKHQFIRNTLGKYERLRHRKAIDALFESGMRVNVFPFRVFWKQEAGVSMTEGPESRVLFGVGVGKRHFKKAVDRNRIKRLTRAAYRLQKQLIVEKAEAAGLHLNLFFIYTGKSMPAYEECFVTVGQALVKVAKAIDPKQ
jgi:ribonuclease P protein component